MTSADNPDQRQGAARKGLFARYPLTFYFFTAYAFSWLVWVPLALSAMLTNGKTGNRRTRISRS